MRQRTSLQGYLSDEGLYPSNFHREFTPAWIDAMLRHRGHAPPRGPRAPFRLLDLGTGDGFGLIVQAAAYPEGDFVGIDGHPPHVVQAEAVAAAIGLNNIRFRRAFFSDLAAPAAADFDYVTAQGVMSWVSADNQAHIRRIAREWLKPGGILCIGYNALPGWKDGLAFQRVVRMFADSEPGDAVARFAAAKERIRALGVAGAASFAPTFMEWIDGLWEKLPRSYFPHEYLNSYWTPHWSADMIAAMAAEDFSFLGSCRSDRLRPDFYLKKAQAAALAEIADPMTREIAEDVILHCSYRTELYGRNVATLADPATARLEGYWASAVAPGDAKLSCRTSAGTLNFDNEAGRAILAALATGPATLASIHRHGAAGTHADILNVVDALLIAGLIMPCDPPADLHRGATANAEIARRAVRGDGINAIVSPHGALPMTMTNIAAGWAGDAAQIAALARLGIAPS